MQTASGDRAADFADVLPWLAREPVLNNLVATATESVLAESVPAGSGRPFYWAIARNGAGQVAGAAICTPPYPIALSAMPDACAAALADHVAADGFLPTGVAGRLEAAQCFAARWEKLGGRAETHRSGLFVYRLDRVIPPAAVPGALRTAGPSDRRLLLDWTDAFLAEIHVGRSSDEQAAQTLDSRLGPGRMFVWDVDGTAVSMTGTSPRVAGVPRVSLVYTPAAHRRNGYAAALVAAVSDHELATGATACMLFTEASNPTSNGVYTRLGYHVVGENAEITF